MADKREKILGMTLFTTTTLFIFWYVNFSAVNHVEIVGFYTKPYGYGSIAYELHNELFGNDYYPYKSSNLFWIATQFLPVLISWAIRTRLGKVSNVLLTLSKKIYEKI